MKASSSLLLVCFCMACACAAAVPLSEWTQGTASFFGGPKDDRSNTYKLTIDSGSCGYGDFDPKLWPFYNVVGLHISNPLVKNRPMSACGSCLEIECNSGNQICYRGKPIQAVITDQCVNDCDSTNVNIHVFGFEQLAPLRFGRLHIRYRLVECEPADPIIIHIQDYRASQGGWIRLALKNVAGDASLTSVEIGAANSTGDKNAWLPCVNTFGAVWEAGLNGVALPSPPLDLRITNSLQQQVIIKNFVAFAGVTGDIETTAQFPSPHESAANTSGQNNGNTAVPATSPVVPSVTIGMAIPRPTNAVTGPTSTFMPVPNTSNLANDTTDATPVADAVLPQPPTSPNFTDTNTPSVNATAAGPGLYTTAAQAARPSGTDTINKAGFTTTDGAAPTTATVTAHTAFDELVAALTKVLTLKPATAVRASNQTGKAVPVASNLTTGAANVSAAGGRRLRMFTHH